LETIEQLWQQGPAAPAKALKAWQILLTYARSGRPITYGQLADHIGLGETANTVTHNAVVYVMAYCSENDLPPLNAIVCNRDTGLPGDGLPDFSSVFGVFEFDWWNIRPPTTEELRQAWVDWQARQ